MKAFKKCFFVAAFALSSSLLCAFDWGGGIHNYTQFKGNKFSKLKLDQIDDFNLWIKVPLDKEGMNYFAAEGLYEFELDDTEVYNQLDVNLFKFSFTKETQDGEASLSIGRFAYSDLSGIVYSQKADGLLASYSNSLLSFSLYAAYTGLLNGNIVSIIPNSGDVHVTDKKKVYDFAAKYLVAGLTLSLPNLIANQTFAFQFFSTSKLEEKHYYRNYVTLAGSGPIAGMLFYNLSSTIGLDCFDDGKTNASNLSQLNFTYFFSFKSAAVTAGIVYASGENGPFKRFNGFTECEAYSSLAKPMYSGVMKLTAGASIKPTEILLLNADTQLIFDTSDKAAYKGFQYGLAATVQPFSDLLLRASIKHYLDKEDSGLNKVLLNFEFGFTF